MARSPMKNNPRHQAILDFLTSYQAEHGYPASIRDIADGCGIGSTSVVNYYLDQLEKAGRIKRDPLISRSIVVIEGAGQ